MKQLNDLTPIEPLESTTASLDENVQEEMQARFAEAVANRFGLSEPEWKALVLKISPHKFGAWRKRVARRRAKNKVARRSRARNAR